MKRSRFFKFLEVFLLGTAPSPELLAAFALGLVVVGITAELIYDLLTVPVEIGMAAWRPVLACLVLTGLAYALYQLDRRKGRDVNAVVDESRLAPPHAGLIWLFGPGRFDHLLSALDHHRLGGGADHCWLVMQDAPKVCDAYDRLSQQLVEEGQGTDLHPFYIESPDVKATYQAVRDIFEREIAEQGLSSDQVIADITGGTKPMTAGMVLATLTAGRQMEYVESKRDEEGGVIPNTQQVVLTDTAFYVTRKGE